MMDEHNLRVMKVRSFFIYE